MQTERYRLSFGTGGLFRQESVRIAELFLAHKDWESVREVVETQNILQCRTASTTRRRAAEIITRLKKLNVNELSQLALAHPRTQAYILWIANCRCYRFISDFAIDVIMDRFTALKSDITYTDFDLFFERKSLLHHELSKVSSSTRMKLRQVLFKMMREAGIIDEDNRLIHALLSPALCESFVKDSVLFLPLIRSSNQPERHHVGY